jgi:hypothetical protein
VKRCCARAPRHLLLTLLLWRAVRGRLTWCMCCRRMGGNRCRSSPRISRARPSGRTSRARPSGRTSRARPSGITSRATTSPLTCHPLTAPHLLRCTSDGAHVADAADEHSTHSRIAHGSPAAHAPYSCDLCVALSLTSSRASSHDAYIKSSNASGASSHSNRSVSNGPQVME